MNHCQFETLDNREFLKKSSSDEKTIETQIKEISILISDAKEEKLSKLQQYHEGKISRDSFMTQKRELDQFIGELNQEIEGKTKELTSLIEQMRTKQDDVSLLLQFEDSKKLTEEMVSSFIEKIVVHEDKSVDIYWKFNGDICKQSL